uniref:Uncharacterized protein n=1 Tax=Oryza nivara TaxID=4536 RepID=A0A0E0ITX3_ORYNI
MPGVTIAPDLELLFRPVWVSSLKTNNSIEFATRLFGRFFLCIALKIPLDSQELKWTKKATLKLPKATFHEASHSLGWTCGRGFGQVDMIHNGGTRESSDRLALLRPSKCLTARMDQYPTGQ